MAPPQKPQPESLFCPHPWTSAYVHTNGMMQACCVAEERLKDDAGTSLRWNALERAEDSLQSPQLKNLRSALLGGKKHPACASCWKAEALGVVSTRQHSLQRFSHRIDEAQARALTSADGSLAGRPELQYVDFRPGNFCNLKCRMCGPGCSTGWYRDYAKLSGENTYYYYDDAFPVGDATTGAPDPFAWGEDEAAWNKLIDLARTAKERGRVFEIYFGGGEPLINRRHLGFLKKLIAEDLHQSVSLTYATNLLKLDPQILGVWEQFQNVFLGISMDGVGTVNDYIRYPGGFSRLEQNIHSIVHSRVPHFWLQTSVSALNAWHVPDLMRWSLAKSRELSRPIRIVCHFVFFPEYLQCAVIPHSVRPAILERLQHGLTEVRAAKQEPRLAAIAAEYEVFLSGLVQTLQNDDFTHLWPQFCEENRKLDGIRSKGFSEALVPLTEMLRAASLDSLPF